MRLKWEYMLTAVFLIFAVIFLLLIGLEINLGKSYRAQKLNELFNVSSAGFSMDDIPRHQFSHKALGDYSHIVERPLFFKSRQPIIDHDDKEPSDKEVKPFELINIDLTGIINTPEGIFALFQNPKAKLDEKKFKRFSQGDEINDWQLKEIQNDRVIIFSESKEKEILLSKPRLSSTKKRKPRRSNPFNKKH